MMIWAGSILTSQSECEQIYFWLKIKEYDWPPRFLKIFMSNHVINRRQILEYSMSNIRLCLVKPEPGSLKIRSNPNRGFERQIFDLLFTDPYAGGQLIMKR